MRLTKIGACLAQYRKTESSPWVLLSLITEHDTKFICASQPICQRHDVAYFCDIVLRPAFGKNCVASEEIRFTDPKQISKSGKVVEVDNRLPIPVLQRQLNQPRKKISIKLNHHPVPTVTMPLPIAA